MKILEIAYNVLLEQELGKIGQISPEKSCQGSFTTPSRPPVKKVNTVFNQNAIENFQARKINPRNFPVLKSSA